jgi:hypothetical protein
VKKYCKKSKANEQIIIEQNFSRQAIRNRILIGTPTLGIVRAEWAQARYGQVIPCNWSAASANIGFSHVYPLNYLVAEAQNVIVHTAVEQNYEWIFLLEDDVILPANAFLILNEYMKKVKVPVVSGLYYLKGQPTEPLVYRGRGNGCYDKFKIGEKVWVDGVPTGALLIHRSIFKLMWDESPEYTVSMQRVVRKVFETPVRVWTDPETNTQLSACGTSDLFWCDRAMREKVFARAGWKKLAKEKYPFLVDTNLFCRHIDINTGLQYPMDKIRKG